MVKIKDEFNSVSGIWFRWLDKICNNQNFEDLERNDIFMLLQVEM